MLTQNTTKRNHNAFTRGGVRYVVVGNKIVEGGYRDHGQANDIKPPIVNLALALRTGHFAGIDKRQVPPRRERHKHGTLTVGRKAVRWSRAHGARVAA